MQKVFLYDPTLIHNKSVTDRRTDGRETDDNGTIDACSIAVIKKLVKYCVQYMPMVIIIVRELKFHANFDVENESSTYGTFIPGKRKFSGTKVPLTVLVYRVWGSIESVGLS